MSSGSFSPSVSLSSISSLITSHPDFPSPGILFYDVFPIFKSPSAVNSLFQHVAIKVKQEFPSATILLGLDSRGFLFAPPVASLIDLAFAPVRKAGKLPGKTVQQGYQTEYSKDCIEIQADAIKQGDQVVIIDDLLATGGTLFCACDLVKQCGATVLGCLVIVEIEELKGKEKVGAPVVAMFQR
jgi:adenine phosphoribosyltransferase